MAMAMGSGNEHIVLDVLLLIKQLISIDIIKVIEL